MRKSIRLSIEALHDYAGYKMSDRTFRIWIYLRCAEGYYGGCFPKDDLIASYCRIKPAAFAKAVKEMLDLGAIERGPDGIISLVSSHYEADRTSASEWYEIRSQVFARDDYTCTYCGERGGKLECDHIHPFSRGGSDSLENLTTSCFSCNRSKRDKTLAEWRPNGTHSNN
jgi:hypothetical protein